MTLEQFTKAFFTFLAMSEGKVEGGHAAQVQRTPTTNILIKKTNEGLSS